MNALPVIIDTDPGLGEPGSVIDDGLAIAFALASPELEVLGLTIVNGNVGAQTGYALADTLLRRLGRTEVPLHIGATAPIRQDMNRVWEVFRGEAVQRFTREAPSGTRSLSQHPTSDAVRWLIDQVASRPGEITLLAIGPMTNIAEAIECDPGFAANTKEIVIMAGNATGQVESITVVADFNVIVDPEAMNIVLRSGASIRMIGIDQTSRVKLYPGDAHKLRERESGTGVLRWLAECIDAWIEVPDGLPEDSSEGASCLLHDPLVVASVIRPEICAFAAFDVTVDFERGDLEVLKLHSPEARRVRAAIDTDVPAFHALFLERLAAL